MWAMREEDDDPRHWLGDTPMLNLSDDKRPAQAIRIHRQIRRLRREAGG